MAGQRTVPVVIAPWHRRRALEARVHKLERTLEKLRRPGPVALDYEPAEVVINSETKTEAKRRRAVYKEPWTVEWIESLGAGDVLYDIGANVGVYSLIAAKRPRGALRVLAFEPGYANFAALCTNIALNGVGDDVTPLPITLGSETRLGRFRYSDVAPGAALHAGAVDDVDVEAVFEQPVLVYRLDELVERFALPGPGHLKIDVDGAELAVLQGAAGLLGSPSLRTVLVELSQREDRAVDELLTAHGLRRTDEFSRGGLTKDGTPNPYWYALYER